MPMGRVASQFLAKVIDWFGHNRDFRVRGQGFSGVSQGSPEHENLDCDQTNLFFFLKIGINTLHGHTKRQSKKKVDTTVLVNRS